MERLPEEFVNEAGRLLGGRLCQQLMEGLRMPATVSIRVNAAKCRPGWVGSRDAVPWCHDGFYLDARPDFTFDPLLHAGLYYVQDASSMIVDTIIRQLVSRPVRVLDLCAAPGGKAMCAADALPEGSFLLGNEPVRRRARLLLENVMKRGGGDIGVGSQYARDFSRAGLRFDIVMADVPCSGEGMFRKDPAAVRDWSPKKVASCARLQREIIGDIWPCLRPGGLLIYSTCTFNAHENEDNVAWIARELGAEGVEVETDSSWHVAGPLTGSLPACRFFPGTTRGEGLFVAVLRKKGDGRRPDCDTVGGGKRPDPSLPDFITAKEASALALQGRALSTDRRRAEGFPRVDVDWHTAISYLRHEAVRLSADVERGLVLLTYRHIPLGFCKNVGSRANNLYPAEWRIKSTHLPKSVPNIINITL